MNIDIEPNYNQKQDTDISKDNTYSTEQDTLIEYFTLMNESKSNFSKNFYKKKIQKLLIKVSRR